MSFKSLFLARKEFQLRRRNSRLRVLGNAGSGSVRYGGSYDKLRLLRLTRLRTHRDAISAANGVSDPSGLSNPQRDPPRSSESSQSETRDNPYTSTSDASHESSHTRVGYQLEDDPETYRVQPPLRVINASTLSSKFTLDSIEPRRSWVNPDEAGRVRSRRAGSTAESLSSGTERSTTSSVDFQGPRTAPLDATFPLDSSTPTKSSELKARSKSVPSTPSVQNLKGMSLVRQRLAGYENTPPPPPRQSPSKASSSICTTSPRKNIGLSTPPVSPSKPLIWQYLAKAPSETSTAMSRYSTQSSVGMSRFDASSQGVEFEVPVRSIPLTVAPTLTEPFSSVRSELEYGTCVAQEPTSDVYSRSSSFHKPISKVPDASSLESTSVGAGNGHSIESLHQILENTALEHAAQAKALQNHLEELTAELKSLPRTTMPDEELTLRDAGYQIPPDVGHALDQVQAKLDQVILNQETSTRIPLHEVGSSLDKLKDEMLSRQTEGFQTVQSKLSLLDNVVEAMAASQKSTSSDRDAWSSKLDSVIASLQGVDLARVNERLDGMRASLAVLEAVTKGQASAPALAKSPSAFRDSSNLGSATGVDLTPIHQKLDSLAIAQSNIASRDTAPMSNTLQSILELVMGISGKLGDEVHETHDGSKSSPDDVCASLFQFLSLIQVPVTATTNEPPRGPIESGKVLHRHVMNID